MRTVAFLLACVMLMGVPARAQWVKVPPPSIPRTPDGKPNVTAPVPRAIDGKPDRTDASLRGDSLRGVQSLATGLPRQPGTSTRGGHPSHMARLLDRQVGW